VQAKLRAQKAFMALNLVSLVREEGAIEGGFRDLEFVKGVCVLNFPETPPLPLIVVTERGDDEIWKRKHAIMEQFVDFSLHGEVFATYAKASVWRLPVLPILAIGCGLNDAKPSWDCFADFMRTHEVIDATPKGVDKALFDSPESIVLGLRKLTRADYAAFKGDSRWSDLIAHIADYPEEQTINPGSRPR